MCLACDIDALWCTQIEALADAASAGVAQKSYAASASLDGLERGSRSKIAAARRRAGDD